MDQWDYSVHVLTALCRAVECRGAVVGVALVTAAVWVVSVCPTVDDKDWSATPAVAWGGVVSLTEESNDESSEVVDNLSWITWEICIVC